MSLVTYGSHGKEVDQENAPVVLKPFVPRGAVAVPLFARDNKTIRAWTLIDRKNERIVSQHVWRYIPPGPRTRSGYAARGTRRAGHYQRVHLHRAILGVSEGVEVDHVDGNGLNNRRKNLRPATTAENSRNRRAYTNNTSTYKGVYFSTYHKKFKAQIGIDNRRKALGYYDTPQEAALAYNEAALRLHGEFARLNDVA